MKGFSRSREPGAESSSHRNSRGRRLAAGILSTTVSRGVGAVAPVVLIPTMYRTLGPNLFGLWVTLTTFTAMVAFADLGLGNGLMTRLAPCYSHRDDILARRYISTAYALLGAASASILAAVFAFSGIIPWGVLLHTGGDLSYGEVRNIAVVCLAVFILNIPASLIARVQYAYQMVGHSNLWQAAGGVLSLLLAVGAARMQASATLVVLAAAGGPLAANVVNTLWFFGVRRRSISPGLRFVERKVTGKLLGLSGQFLVLTIVTSFALNADPIIIAHALNLEAVAAYSVPARVVGLLGMLINVINVPLWTTNGDALAQGEVSWVIRTTRLMSLVSSLSVAVVGSVMLALSGSRLSDWLGIPRSQASLIVGLVLWWTIVAALSPAFMTQNAAGVTAHQLAGWTGYLLLSIPGKWISVRYLGISSLPYVGAAIYLCLVVPAAMAGYRAALARYSGRPSSPSDFASRSSAARRQKIEVTTSE